MGTFSLLLKGIQQTTGVRLLKMKKVKNQPTLLCSTGSVENLDYFLPYQYPDITSEKTWIRILQQNGFDI
jgi:hypothetical protein